MDELNKKKLEFDSRHEKGGTPRYPTMSKP